MNRRRGHRVLRERVEGPYINDNDNIIYNVLRNVSEKELLRLYNIANKEQGLQQTVHLMKDFDRVCSRIDALDFATMCANAGYDVDFRSDYFVVDELENEIRTFDDDMDDVIIDYVVDSHDDLDNKDLKKAIASLG